MPISITISITIFCIVEHGLPISITISITIFRTVEHPFKAAQQNRKAYKTHKKSYSWLPQFNLCLTTLHALQLFVLLLLSACPIWKQIISEM